jgi:hypothetical protein
MNKLLGYKTAACQAIKYGKVSSAPVSLLEPFAQLSRQYLQRVYFGWNAPPASKPAGPVVTRAVVAIWFGRDRRCASAHGLGNDNRSHS